MSKFYANKEKREELGALSLKVFGRKGIWHKYVLKGHPVEKVENMLLEASKKIDEMVLKAKEAPKNEP